jgi:IMP dehydrogenase
MAKREIREALTFDDVSLQPGFSNFLPAQADVTTKFTRNIRLNIPIISAAMDTVTEAHLAIALAQQGGIGVIHKNLSIERQREEVDMVKRSESGMIVDAVTIFQHHSVGEARALMDRYKISGIPVVDEQGMLVGIITNRDLRFEQRSSIKVSEVMTKENLITVPVGTTLEQAKQLLGEHRIEKLPVVDGEGKLKGLITVKDIEKAIQYPFSAKDDLGRLRVAAAIGAGGDFAERAQELVKARVDALVIDTAHGHTQGVLDAIKTIKHLLSECELVAGNIATAAAAKALVSAGADAVKVGMGPGSICTTRIVSGAGMPQITAVMDCAEAISGSGVPLIADGGIKYSGDITKAIAAGADSVMIGSLFAGTEESPGETILFQGRSFKSYRGMGSIAAMNQGSKDRYGQAGQTQVSKLVPEGIEGRVPHKGPLVGVVDQFVGGLRAGMGYCGCSTIEELKARAEFVRVTSAGLRESHVHDVIITKEAPNYRVD